MLYRFPAVLLSHIRDSVPNWISFLVAFAKKKKSILSANRFSFIQVVMCWKFYLKHSKLLQQPMNAQIHYGTELRGIFQ